eukprot:gene13679-biopygen8669
MLAERSRTQNAAEREHSRTRTQHPEHRTQNAAEREPRRRRSAVQPIPPLLRETDGACAKSVAARIGEMIDECGLGGLSSGGLSGPGGFGGLGGLLADSATLVSHGDSSNGCGARYLVAAHVPRQEEVWNPIQKRGMKCGAKDAWDDSMYDQARLRRVRAHLADHRGVSDPVAARRRPAVKA